MYAIKNIMTGKFVYGTDKRYSPYHQRTSDNRMLTYDTLYSAKSDFRFRQCGNDYRIVKLGPIITMSYIPFDNGKKYEVKEEDLED